MRTLRMRLFETLGLAAAGLAFVIPAYAAVYDVSLGGSLRILAPVAVAAVLWAPLHSVVFGYFDWHLTRRLPRDRTEGWHAGRGLSLGLSWILLAVPLLLWRGNLGPAEALLTAAALALLCAGGVHLIRFLRDRRGGGLYPTRKCFDSFNP